MIFISGILSANRHVRFNSLYVTTGDPNVFYIKPVNYILLTAYLGLGTSGFTHQSKQYQLLLYCKNKNLV